MARRHRSTPGGYVYHVCNRGSRKGVLFESCEDYLAFITLMEEARRKRPMRITAYCLMSNHVHFLLWPEGDDDVPRFMKWLTATHASRWHRRRESVGSGAVYQSRYVSRAISDTRQLLSAMRYVERNALTAGAVKRAEEWRWSSAWNLDDSRSSFTTDPGPITRPPNWLKILNDV